MLKKLSVNIIERVHGDEFVVGTMNGMYVVDFKINKIKMVDLPEGIVIGIAVLGGN